MGICPKVPYFYLKQTNKQTDNKAFPGITTHENSLHWSVYFFFSIRDPKLGILSLESFSSLSNIESKVRTEKKRTRKWKAERLRKEVSNQSEVSHWENVDNHLSKENTEAFNLQIPR